MRPVHPSSEIDNKIETANDPVGGATTAVSATVLAVAAPTLKSDNPATSIALPDGNIRSLIGIDDAELRESMREFGWVSEFPALVDENGTTLVGHRRLKIAAELGIPPVVKPLTLGTGTEADAERFKLALVSNIGGAPLSREDRKRIAECLYGAHEWTMERIAKALRVGTKTVARDLEGFVSVTKPPRPKGGRPKAQPKSADPRPIRKKIPPSSPDWTDDVKRDLRAKCNDHVWRVLAKTARRINRAESATHEALLQLFREGIVERRPTGNDDVFEYRVKPDEAPDEVADKPTASVIVEDEKPPEPIENALAPSPRPDGDLIFESALTLFNKIFDDNKFRKPSAIASISRLSEDAVRGAFRLLGLGILETHQAKKGGGVEYRVRVEARNGLLAAKNAQIDSLKAEVDSLKAEVSFLRDELRAANELLGGAAPISSSLQAEEVAP
jgi:ParB-like chromosome segregation protein Spo0J